MLSLLNKNSSSVQFTAIFFMNGIKGFEEAFREKIGYMLTVVHYQMGR